MIRVLSLTAALALLPLSSALAQDAGQTTPPAPGSAEARLEAASASFEARMARFGERAEAISEDKSLTDEQKGLRISALWAEYSPEVAAFTAEATRMASSIAAEALKDIDVDALVSDALNDPEVQDAIQGGVMGAQGVVANSAWTNPDPEQMETYGLIAQYALDQAGDVVEALEVPAVPAPPAPPEPTPPEA